MKSCILQMERTIIIPISSEGLHTQGSLKYWLIDTSPNFSRSNLSFFWAIISQISPIIFHLSFLCASLELLCFLSPYQVSFPSMTRDINFVKSRWGSSSWSHVSLSAKCSDKWWLYFYFYKCISGLELQLWFIWTNNMSDSCKPNWSFSVQLKTIFRT